MDFERYLKDSLLKTNANLFSYDRIGYGIYHTGDVQASIEFERAMLEGLITELPIENTILVGYSYGGPVVLASHRKYKKLVLLAPAVSSTDESEPWALNLYKWRLTRWMVPKTWRAASIEKMTHAQDLISFEKQYVMNPSEVLCIHGDEDWIVPYQNSLFLKNNLVSERFKLVTLKETGHGLVWSQFEAIRDQILAQIKQ
jgi:pimeloyl-ACP methyl ester carboxylesterase